jgi:hypothetical protein
METEVETNDSESLSTLEKDLDSYSRPGNPELRTFCGAP